MSRRSFAELIDRLERRCAAGQDEAAEPGACALPPGHSCLGGWHLRRDPKTGLEAAYLRCPRWQAERAAAAAGRVSGAQSFESFERLREPEAFQAVRAWVDACREGRSGIVALLRPAALDANTGCGKTHLLRAAARELVRGGRSVELATALDLTAVVRGRALYDSAERAAAESQARRWSQAEVFLLDDLGQEETAGPATASFLVGLLDRRDGRPLGWSSNLDEAGLRSRYGAPLASRLLGGARVPGLRGRDYRQGLK